MKIDGDIAELLGAHIGDGCISENERYSEYYLGGDITEEKDYHDNWIGPLFNAKIMRPLFNKDVVYKSHQKVGIYGFHIFNKNLVNFFKDFGICSGSKINVGIPSEILKDKSLTTRFLRGLFDTDGNLFFDKNRSAKSPKNDRPMIKIGTVSIKLANEVHSALTHLGFHPAMKKPHKGKKDKNFVYTVQIYRIGDVNRYIEEIGFKNPKHFTKWQVYKKFGYCPSHTRLSERLALLSNSKPF